MNLEDLRREINGIDDEIMRLFVKRMLVVKNIAHEKADKNMPVTDLSREKQIIARVVSGIPENMTTYAEKIMTAFIEVSKEYQEELAKNTEDKIGTIK